MGEAVYSLKAQFSSKKEAKAACKDLNLFFKENEAVQRMSAGADHLDTYPMVKEYLQIIKGDWKDLQDYGWEDEVAHAQGDVLIYSANVGHLGSWDNLQTFIEQKYKPLKMVWGSEEYGGSLEALNLYEWEAIVKGILKHKKTLPLLLNIHDDLDALISIALRSKHA